MKCCFPRKGSGKEPEFRASRVLYNLPCLTILESKKERKKESKNSILSDFTNSPSLQPLPFLQFWEVYPKRAGCADRKSAEKAFAAALNRKIPFDEILAGAKRYAAHCDVTQKTKTEFVRQARTWLNKEGWSETYETPRTIQKPNSIAGGFEIINAALDAEERSIREEEERLRISGTDAEILPRLWQVTS